ncbi:MAG: hypothetical protein P8P74_01995 [Crocinitomicaceae bacterium]|nr:hypothetical protein [Crocinitomicaceae bacterium]
MSWTDEEIDNLFKDGAEAQSFKYDDAYFAEVEGALPVNGKGKDFLWMGTALVFIAVLTTGYFVNNANDTSFNNTNDQLANVELTTANENTNTANTSNETTVSNGDQNESTTNAASNDLNNELSNNESANSNGNENSAAAPNKNNSGNSSSTNTGDTKVQPAVGPNSMYNFATRNVRNGGSNNTNITQTVGQQDSSTEDVVDTRSNAKTFDQKESALQSAPITASLDLNGANELDQNLNQKLAPNAMPIGLGLVSPKAALYFEMNAGISQSLITPSEIVSKSIGGGLGVETYLGSFNLNTGVNFKASFHDDLYLTRKGKVYGFGSNEGTNQYDVQKIYSIEMPITLGYNFERHNVNIGVRPSFIVGAQTQKHVFEDEQFLRREQINGLIEEEIGGQSISALMRFGLKPTVGYSYRFNSWTIGANVGVQLMQSVNEDLIDGYNNQLPIDGQIYLRRTIRLRK